MSRLRVPFVSSAFAWSAIACRALVSMAAGCLDFTPSVVAQPEAGAEAAPAPDAAMVDGGACSACVQGAACASEYEACTSTAKCGVMFECGLANGCYAMGANLLSCLAECGAQAQLSGVGDPAVKPFTALYECAVGSCASVCQ
jgi:hypothetical protein